jgi:hypothetical protein
MRLFSSTTAASTMKGATVKNRNSCKDDTLMSNRDSTNGPRPWAVPQSARIAIAIAEVLTPVDPKRKADPGCWEPVAIQAVLAWISGNDREPRARSTGFSKRDGLDSRWRIFDGSERSA